MSDAREQRMTFTPGDVLMVTVDDDISEYEAEQIGSSIKARLGDIPVLIATGGARFSVLHRMDSDEPTPIFDAITAEYAT